MSECACKRERERKSELNTHTHTHNAGDHMPARGPPDFGWDPIFQPQGFQLTYAEMEKEVKNTISHRYKALCALRDHLTTSPTEEGEGEGGETKRVKLT